jgi:hypothetical protein
MDECVDCTLIRGQSSSNLLLGSAPSVRTCGSAGKKPHPITAKEIKVEITIKVGSIAHRILSLLATNGEMTVESMKKTGALAGKSLVDIENVLFQELLPAGMILLGTDNKIWGLTNKGLDAKIELGNADKLYKMPRKTVMAQQNNLFARGNYGGEELRDTCLRRGAYDAYDLPSRSHNSFTYRKGVQA